MISSIKTPGVYVREINGFPPSIAQVATAIPSFVGYTAKGPTNPVKITSLLEYEENFGGAPQPADVNIDLNVEYSVVESQFKLYNSLRLFFANGGGECYIVSIGDYDTATPFSATPFNNGLNLVEKVDEVTLLVFPDAVNMSASNLGNVQKHALKQCKQLMDRFVIMDTKQEVGGGLNQDAENFRNNLGNQNLKYGAAYYPYLQTNFGYNFRFNDINGTDPGKVDFKTLYASDTDIESSLLSFEDLTNDINDDSDGILKEWEDAQSSNPKMDITDDTNVASYIENIFGLLGTVQNPEADISDTDLQNLVKEMISVSLKPFAQKLVDINDAYDNLAIGGGGDTDAANLTSISADFENAQWGDFADTGNANYPISSPNPYSKLIESSSTPGEVDFAKLKAQLDKLYGQVTTAMNALIDTIKDYELKMENDLTSQLPIYPSIISELNKSMNTVPPSGAVAGIYANVDASRGVWKAPANVSVNGIIGLTDDITHNEQSTMNIHESGKSINAIRKFTGKGLLVWGARTLDGNSNDWRYINVRRLANMIQESTKKACMNFVFEPNVKQTWVNVKGMIENYLTTLWGDGALAGAKAEDAFFVSVGLNETMSPQDINEGRLIVKVGYAPSRPAEFIILEFTQVQQKS